MQYDIVDYDGKPLPGSAPTYSCEWWPQAETMRALMHWAVVRGKDGYAEPYRRVQRFIHRYFIDHEYGGWFQRLSTAGPEGASFGVMGTDKGSVWKNGYHAAMLYVEARRLAEEYPERVKALSIR
jgi:mannose/cellobiose epimerase-like protein (N-acyl-D-glucosamine 2-epimerase family)